MIDIPGGERFAEIEPIDKGRSEDKKHIQRLDGVPVKLKGPFDFSFLKKYGRVFKAYDDQDSGNICFGVTDGRNRYFVKFAGAPTERATISAGEAIANLKSAEAVYKDLAHENLITLIAAEEIL